MRELDKIIINSYDFPPSESVMTGRILTFANVAKKNNLEPIVVSYLDPSEVSELKSYTEIEPGVIMSEDFGYPVYYILKNKTASSSLDRIKRLLYYKVASITDGSWGLRKHKKLLVSLIGENNPSAVIYSVNPFQFIGLGKRVASETNVPWIIDYRDDWSTSEVVNTSVFKRLFQKLYKPFELKWTKTAHMFSTVTESYVQKIGDFNRLYGMKVENGFSDKDLPSESADPHNDVLTITYAGSLYQAHNAEIFLEGMNEFLERTPNARVQVNFLSLKDQPLSLARVKDLSSEESFEKYVFTHRLSQAEALDIQKKSDLLLLIGFNDTLGISGSKLYGYIQSGRPILYAPSDQGVIAQKLQDTGQLISALTSDEVAERLESLYAEWLETGAIKSKIKTEDLYKFTREYQTQKLFDDPHFQSLIKRDEKEEKEPVPELVKMS